MGADAIARLSSQKVEKSNIPQSVRLHPVGRQFEEEQIYSLNSNQTSELLQPSETRDANHQSGDRAVKADVSPNLPTLEVVQSLLLLRAS